MENLAKLRSIKLLNPKVGSSDSSSGQVNPEALNLEKIFTSTEAKRFDTNMKNLKSLFSECVAELFGLKIDGSVLIKSKIVDTLKELKKLFLVSENLSFSESISKSISELLSGWKSQVGIKHIFIVSPSLTNSSVPTHMVLGERGKPAFEHRQAEERRGGACPSRLSRAQNVPRSHQRSAMGRSYQGVQPQPNLGYKV